MLNRNPLHYIPRHFLLQVHWPVTIKTNASTTQFGVQVGWAPAPNNLTYLQLRAMTPLVCSLLLAYEHANDAEKLRTFAGVVDLLPHDSDLDFVWKLSKKR